MFNHINKVSDLPKLIGIESNLFRELQDAYKSILMSILEEVDEWLMNNRDFDRFENREKQKTTLATMFGEVPINRRKYLDRNTGARVALLDKYLEYDGSDSLSPFLTEMVVKWSVRGPSYRDARDRFCDLLGYQATSHETIRQEVLKINSKEIESSESTPRKEKDVLFLEVDGLNVHKQNSTRRTRETKIGVVHEGWEKEHPSSNDYMLKNKSYWKSLETGQVFWEDFSRHVYEKYEITDRTHIVINGDGAPWIRAGTEYFPNATYTYNRYHLKKWIKKALGKRTKQERRKAYQAADANDPVALLVAIAEAEQAETDDEKQEEIKELRLFVYNNQEAFRDYREILKEKDEQLNTSWMRPMGAAESNMNLFSRRLKKMGCSWSFEGLKAMTSALIHRFEGTLIQAINNQTSDTHNQRESQSEEYPSFAPLLTQRTRQSIGAIQGHMPALVGDDQHKPYIRALRGLAGY